MNRKNIPLLFIALLLGCSAASAEEIHEIAFGDLPESVKTAALTLVDKKSISKVSRIDDNNHLRFEIEADKTENKKDVISWDIVIADNGKVMKVGKEVPYFTLTYSQMQEIEQRYPNIKVTEAESVDIHFFNIIGDIDGRPVRFKFHEDGTIETQDAP